MSVIKYIQGDLFTHSIPSSKKIILAHACNTQGSWGGGIAAIFRKSSLKQIKNIVSIVMKITIYWVNHYLLNQIIHQF